jgi:hypothetical protein
MALRWCISRGTHHDQGGGVVAAVPPDAGQLQRVGVERLQAPGDLFPSCRQGSGPPSLVRAGVACCSTSHRRRSRRQPGGCGPTDAPAATCWIQDADSAGGALPADALACVAQEMQACCHGSDTASKRTAHPSAAVARASGAVTLQHGPGCQRCKEHEAVQRGVRAAARGGCRPCHAVTCFSSRCCSGCSPRRARSWWAVST